MNSFLMWLAAFLALAGSAVTLVAAVGVLRLPDFFMRMHAATKAGVAGPSLILLAAGCFDPSISTWIKILFAILFLLTTTPISGNLIGRAGFIGGVTLWRKTVRNDLESVLPHSEFIEVVTPDPDDSSETTGLGDSLDTAKTAAIDVMTDSHEGKPNR